MTTIYGIKNCDMMKKARTWLKEQAIEHTFWNYKKDGIDQPVLEKAIAEHGWETVINQRGTTWHTLDDATKSSMDADKAIPLARENPSIIKRPLLVKDGKTYLGFKLDQYESIFK